NPNLDNDYPFLQEVGNIISAACLSHDLGNPAFGHSGESAISTYFTDGDGRKYQEQVTAEEWADLTHFEGNANALRILTHAFQGKDPKGFALTYTSLASIVKYPCLAIDGHLKKSHHRKKYGFFTEEQKAFEKVANELGLLKDPSNSKGYLRHPLVYLVEAADDICYNIIDLEDAHHLKILSYQEVEELLLPLCGKENLRDRLDGLLDTPSRVALLRAKAINTLIKGCVDVFVREQDKFLSGTFGSALMDALDEDIVTQMKKISKISIAKIYNAPTVVQIEIAGYRVMDALLKEFVPAYLKKNKNNYDKKLVALIPEQFYTDKQDSYSKIRCVLDFVSGMTDVYAIELYRKIKGITIPSIE
ncbi:MAG TPA: dehydrogenase, partial [Sphingobacterium sp.]|nr:dehydrogenase [Sphingobacterium sp.]